MAKKAPFYLRQWRKHRGYTLERLAEMVGTSAGVISDLEKGNRRFNQDHLEMFAEALNCAPADLLMRDPSQPEGMWSIWNQLGPTERVQAEKVIRALKGTGTDG